MPGLIKVTKNDYFTHMQDGDTEYVFRDSQQVWNVKYGGVDYVSHVSGPNKQPAFLGQYNCFAKKHLMTIKGGKRTDGNYLNGLRNQVGGEKRIKFGSDEFDRTVRGKLNSIHEKRTQSEDWEVGEKFDGYTQKRADRLSNMDPSAGAHYQQGALGGRGISDTTPLTVVLCDLLSADDLKEAFAEAIHGLPKQHKVTGATTEHVRVKFWAKCVYQHRNSDNDFDRGDTIKVSIYIESASPKKIEAHIVHCSGT